MSFFELCLQSRIENGKYSRLENGTKSLIIMSNRYLVTKTKFMKRGYPK